MDATGSVDSLLDQLVTSKSNDVPGINKKEKMLINNTAPEDSLKALSNSISIRRDMLELNDKLCAHETGMPSIILLSNLLDYLYTDS